MHMQLTPRAGIHEALFQQGVLLHKVRALHPGHISLGLCLGEEKLERHDIVNVLVLEHCLQVAIRIVFEETVPPGCSCACGLGSSCGSAVVGIFSLQ